MVEFVLGLLCGFYARLLWWSFSWLWNESRELRVDVLSAERRARLYRDQC